MSDIQLTSTSMPVGFRTWFGRYTCFFIVNCDALAQASDFRIERRHVVFLCWMQDSKLGSLRHEIASRLNAHSLTDWAIVALYSGNRGAIALMIAAQTGAWRTRWKLHLSFLIILTDLVPAVVAFLGAVPSGGFYLRCKSGLSSWHFGVGVASPVFPGPVAWLSDVPGSLWAWMGMDVPSCLCT